MPQSGAHPVSAAAVFIVSRELRELVLFQLAHHTTLAASGAGDINYSALTPAGAIWQILRGVR